MNIRRTFGTFPFVVAISLLAIAGSGFAVISSNTAFAQQQHFTAKLSGANEVPSITSAASGMAAFDLNAAGTQMKYTLNVTNINHVIAAHIHMGSSTANGPTVVNLFIPSKATGKVDGTLAQSSINSTSLIGPLKGKQMTDLISLINGGKAYVNVHTTQNPPGEVRGQMSSGSATSASTATAASTAPAPSTSSTPKY
ncbi:MAG: CHRD domain-containing protein [Nitrosopumilales archaeon]|nr:CHRD domain-containing protein [Nitrosopumilales archaeon]